ncbi:BTAD domain-containing putative transcriptional regulator [Streptomyces chartreusis]|uniref:AfsR/SARP family transcriptional regulator n=1 Tax=Streptomyces chartreusis TaxID=1969 RepID=UPI003D89B8FD
MSKPLTPVTFSILGPLTVKTQGRALCLGPLKQRLVLGMLLCHPNTVVQVDQLIEAVWDVPPRTARKNLQVYISALRKTLACAGERVEHGSGGYLLRLAEPELDSLRFQALGRAGREAAAEGAFEAAAGLLDQARHLWSGSPLPELRCSELLQAEATRLTNRYLSVCEDWAEAALNSGRASEVAEAVGDLLEQHPLRERLRAAQMLALHRSGRRGEALGAYDELRQQLSRELGLPPSEALDSLYRSILAADGTNGRSGHRVQSDAPVVLPPDVADFTGRAVAMADLVRLAAGGNVTAVVAPAGTGKTTLAVHAAHHMAEEFPGGRICVRLRGEDGRLRSLASLTTELLRYTGLGERVPQDPNHAAALWRAWLADRRALLILDDPPDEAAVRPLLPGTGQSSAVITARSRLAGLAPTHRIELAPYSITEALELLGRILGPDRIHSDLVAAERIARNCGMLPLAVRVAGLKLSVLRHVSLKEYADRLTCHGSILDELVVGDIDVRSHVADEWQHLDGTRRSALLRLSALPLSEAFTLNQAASAMDCPPRTALLEIESLIESGVIVSPVGEVMPHVAVYSLPHVTHIHAREQAARESTRPSAVGI